MKFNFRRVKQFNSRNYDLTLVKDKDEYDFLIDVLYSFIYSKNIVDAVYSIKTEDGAKVNIHVETNNKTLIKWLLKFGFEKA